jgi:hypothetical protein
MDSGAVCGRASMSGIVPGRSSVETEDFQIVSPRMARDEDAWGASGATLLLLAWGKPAWRGARSLGAPPRTSKSACRATKRVLLLMLKVTCVSETASYGVELAPFNPLQKRATNSPWTSRAGATSPGRGSREICSASCERLSPSMPLIDRCWGNVIPACPRRASSPWLKCRGVWVQKA